VRFVIVIGTEACEHVCRIILNRQLLADVAKLSPLHQTSSIESFHALILRFAPKTCSFSYLGMLCRYSNGKVFCLYIIYYHCSCCSSHIVYLQISL